MKIGKLAALCAKTRTICLFTQKRENEENLQWAGDGKTAYALEGMPTFTAETIMATFGVDMEKKDLWIIKDEPFPKKFDVDTYNPEDVTAMLSMENFVTYAGISYIPVQVSDERVYVQKRYLDMIRMDEETQIVARKYEGHIYLVVMDGMFPTALITPENLNETMKQWISKL